MMKPDPLHLYFSPATEQQVLVLSFTIQPSQQINIGSGCFGLKQVAFIALQRIILNFAEPISPSPIDV